MTKAIIETAERLSREKGENLTELRRLILTILSRQHGAVTAYQLLDLLKEERPNAKPPTIYRGLEFLLQLGIVHRIDSNNSYLVCHHGCADHCAQFLICSRCGHVEEFENQQIDQLLDQVSEQAGFAVSSKSVEVTGLCPACQLKD